jgi:toxin YoeB
MSAAWADYVLWQAEDNTTVARINLLIGECLRHPFTGTGKPEPLKRNLTGWWSRRINREHRLVYRVTGKADAQALEVLSCRYHY